MVLWPSRGLCSSSAILLVLLLLGADNDGQIDGVTKVAPLVALYAGRPEMLQKVEDVVRVTQNDDISVAMALVAARYESFSTYIAIL